MMSSNLDTSPANILSVDDDPDISIALVDLLKHEGYSVESASTGAEAFVSPILMVGPSSNI